MKDPALESLKESRDRFFAEASELHAHAQTLERNANQINRVMLQILEANGATTEEMKQYV